MLPHDPIILLSYVNTQLRDRDANLAALCEAEGTDEGELRKQLAEIGYEYSADRNQFV